MSCRTAAGWRPSSAGQDGVGRLRGFPVDGVRQGCVVRRRRGGGYTGVTGGCGSGWEATQARSPPSRAGPRRRTGNALDDRRRRLVDAKRFAFGHYLGQARAGGARQRVGRARQVHRRAAVTSHLVLAETPPAAAHHHCLQTATTVRVGVGGCRPPTGASCTAGGAGLGLLSFLVRAVPPSRPQSPPPPSGPWESLFDLPSGKILSGPFWYANVRVHAPPPLFEAIPPQTPPL